MLWHLYTQSLFFFSNKAKIDYSLDKSFLMYESLVKPLNFRDIRGNIYSSILWFP